MRPPKPDVMVPSATGLRTRNFFRALAAVVVVVNNIVIGGLVAIELSRLTTCREQAIQYFRPAAVAGVLIVAGEKNFKGIPGLDFALKIYVIGIDAN